MIFSCGPHSPPKKKQIKIDSIEEMIPAGALKIEIA
jgi:hypothetical protein